MAAKSTASEEVRKTAAAVAAAVNKRHGAGTVVLASEAKIPPPRLSSGSLSLDISLSGGWPVNQWSEVVGNENAGKTTIVLKTIAAAQKANPSFTVCWVAAESYDEDYAAFLGVDNSRVYRIEENVMEVAYEIVLEFVATRAVDMAVIDSLPALVPADEDDKTMEEFSPGRGAFRTNQFMRKATKATKRSLTGEDRPIVGIVINQWREKIGVSWGDPRTTPGGKGKNFWFYCRVDVKRDEWITDEDKRKCGQVIKVSTFKMKGAKPREPAIIDFYFADGNGVEGGTYDVYKETLNLARMYDIVALRGNAYVYEDTRYPGGKLGFYRAMQDDSGMFDRLRKEVLEASRGMEDDEDDEPDDEPEPAPEPQPRTRKIRRRS